MIVCLAGVHLRLVHLSVIVVSLLLVSHVSVVVALAVLVIGVGIRILVVVVRIGTEARLQLSAIKQPVAVTVSVIAVCSQCLRLLCSESHVHLPVCVRVRTCVS